MPQFNDAEKADLEYRVAAARRKAELGGRQFNADAAVERATRDMVAERARQLQLTTDQQSDAGRRSHEDGARLARKHMLRNAWKGQ